MNNKLWNITPTAIKTCLAYGYLSLRSPRQVAQNLNMAKYLATADTNPARINFAPPVFDVFASSTCNLSCPTCLFRLKNSEVFITEDFVSVSILDIWLNRYRKVVDTVWLSGGEPLLHPEFHRLVTMLKSKGFRVMLSTNGILVKQQIETLKLVDFISVSVDSHNYQSFKTAREGTQRQYDRILDGLSLMRNNGIRFTTSFVISEENLHEMYDMLGFATQFQPYSVYFHNLNPHGVEGHTPLTTESSAAYPLMRFITRKNDYPFDISLPVIFNKDTDHFRTAKCSQPWSYCYFDASGDVAYCCHLRHDRAIGNIFTGYDFNSYRMTNFRKAMAEGHYPEDCTYCERRFAGDGYGYFNAKAHKWTIGSRMNHA